MTLLSESEFREAREASRSGTVTSELYVFLQELVTLAQATKTLAPAPVPGGRWDDKDAVLETVHAWLADSLMQGGLLQAFDSCQTARALSRYLERALRNWLIDHSKRRTRPRLLERAVEILASDAFVLVRDSNSVMDRWWGLRAWEAPVLFDGGDEEVTSAAWALGDFAILRFSSSERADPLLSTPDLTRYLEGLLDRLEAALSGRHFAYSFRQRFPDSYASAPVELDETVGASRDMTPDVEVAVSDAARIAMASLSERRLTVLLERPETTLDELAKRLGVSRGTVDNEYRAALQTVKEASPSYEDFAKVLEMVVLMASE